LNLARGARKGSDGRIYSSLRDNRTGNTVWKSPQDIADAKVATPDAMNWDSARVPVMNAGKIDYVRREEVDYVLPHFEDAFSHLANLVPLKSGVKPGRMAMGSRYITQALPLTNPEAPLLQGTVAGGNGESYEEEYGRQMGAVRSDKAGRVQSIKDGVITVQHDDGTTQNHEMYEYMPLNRKTYTNQTPVVKEGDQVTPGSLLARSNFTDEKGSVALGTNLKTAYIPWRGYNFKDAIAISESASKKLASEHMYQHDVEVSPQHKIGMRDFVSMFPSVHSKEQLARMGDDGIIRPGETVEYGQPLILAMRTQDRPQNKIHKQRQAGYADESVVWKHHDAGVVTDVASGKKGPVVAVRSASQMQVGDKLSGRYGDKGVVSVVIPDHQMPHDANGKPFEVLLSPLGIVSRTNPTQKIEGWLGKIARKTGKPVKVPDFGDTDDLVEWTRQQMALHGIPDTETLTDPEKNRNISDIATGERFFMKLHHMAESKSKGRGSGGYSADDSPSKGGETGCFTGAISRVARESREVPATRAGAVARVVVPR